MSWQDELRQLDEELAAGKVSAEEYRTRRDTVLARSAAGSHAVPPPQPPVQPGPGPWTQVPPQQFPPPGFTGRGQAAGQPPPDAADRTQVVSPAAQPPASGTESTQVFGAVGPPPDNPERTQVVTGYGGRPQFPPRPDAGQQVGDAPPWAGAEFPPLAGLRQNEPWYSQGPEVFDRRNGSKVKIFAIVGVVVVVALLVGAFFLFKPFSGGSAPQATGPQTTTRQAPRTPTTTPGPLAHISGSTGPSVVHTFSDAVALGFLTPEEVAAFQSGQPTTTFFSDTNASTSRVLALVVKTSDQQSAAAVATQLSQLQIKYQLQSRTGGPVGVSIEASDTAQGGPMRRAEYSSGRYVVRIQVQGKDPVSVDQELTSVLNVQLTRLPANG